MIKKEKYNVAIVGATGLVGQNFIKILEEKNFPIDKLVLLASARSIGKSIHAFGKDINVLELNQDSFKGIDIALFSAGASVALEFAPFAVKSGAKVIDNSSAFRMNKDIPLVVPEVNIKDALHSSIIANPNCSTIQAVLPLKALDDAFKVTNVIYSTYQAVSGSGQKGVDDLKRTLKGEKNQFYPYDISKTCIPEIDIFLENGYTKEEMKMVFETRKILHIDDLKVVATCIRVPVENAHGVNIYVTLGMNVSIDKIKSVLASFPGITVLDDPKNHSYPTSIHASGKDDVFCGRIRKDLNDELSVLLYCVSDNIRKGAALNAVQIASYLINHKEGAL